MNKLTGRRVINSDVSLQTALGDLRQLYNEHKYIRLHIAIGKDRSSEQNALAHCWFEQIARELREQTPIQVKAECKLRLGVPILRAEDPEFRAFYDHGIKHLTYEQKLKAMEYVPVTSLMTTGQLQRFLDDMQREYAQRGVELKSNKEDE